MKGASMTATNHQSLLYFEGQINEETIDQILEAVENKLLEIEPNKKIRKRTFSIFVECLQNVYLHAYRNSLHHLEGGKVVHHKISLSRTDDGYLIETANPVSRMKIARIKDQIERINSLSKNDLDALYLQAWQRARFMPDKGAGLGFIDIVRRSGSKLECNFEPLNGKSVFFTLKVKVLEQVA
jgi:hypothetical protein